MMLIDAFGGLTSWINAHALWPTLPVWAYVVITLIDITAAKELESRLRAKP